jgi:ADP-ribosylglycohydrolase
MWTLSPPFDIGNTISSALCNNQKSNKCLYDEGLSKKFIGNSKLYNAESLSNGFLMRITPLAVWIYFNFKDYLELEFTLGRVSVFEYVYPIIEADSSLTHSNQEAAVGSLIYCYIIFCILRERNKQPDASIKTVFENVWELLDKFIDHCEVRDFMHFDRFPYIRLLKEVKDKKINSKLDALNFLRNRRIGYENQGYYLHALMLCFFFVKNINVYVNESNAYDEIILTVCDMGGDTDTNAAILGGVLGAGFGYKELPKKVDQMLDCVISTHSRKDERRGIYSPGFILFVMQEIYNLRYINLLKK